MLCMPSNANMRGDKSVKRTLEYIQLVTERKLDEREIELLEHWLQRSYEMARSDGIIEILERDRK